MENILQKAVHIQLEVTIAIKKDSSNYNRAIALSTTTSLDNKESIDNKKKIARKASG